MLKAMKLPLDMWLAFAVACGAMLVLTYMAFTGEFPWL